MITRDATSPRWSATAWSSRKGAIASLRRFKDDVARGARRASSAASASRTSRTSRRATSSRPTRSARSPAPSSRCWSRLERFDLRIPGCGSLKQKRHVLKTLTAALRSDVQRERRRGRSPGPLAAGRRSAVAAVGAEGYHVRRVMQRGRAVRGGVGRGGGHRRRAHVASPDATDRATPVRWSMPQGARTERVGEEFREILAEEIQKLKDPRIGFVTVTGVKVTADLRARVGVLHRRSATSKAARVHARRRCGRRRRTCGGVLGQQVRLKFTPGARSSRRTRPRGDGAPRSIG